jgi:hypothetical protein
MMESIRVIVVNSATVNCFVERRNGDGEGRKIGVETWRSIRDIGPSAHASSWARPLWVSRWNIVPSSFGSPPHHNHPTSIHNQDITLLRCIMFKYKKPFSLNAGRFYTSNIIDV